MKDGCHTLMTIIFDCLLLLFLLSVVWLHFVATFATNLICNHNLWKTPIYGELAIHSFTFIYIKYWPRFYGLCGKSGTYGVLIVCIMWCGEFSKRVAKRFSLFVDCLCLLNIWWAKCMQNCQRYNIVVKRKTNKIWIV